MSQYQPDNPMTAEVRLRLPLPIVIPVAALLAIALVAFGMSRILLSVPKEIAVIIAIAIGANVLIAAAFVALRPDDAASSWAELAVVALYPLIIGVVVASLGLGHGDSAGEAEHAAGEAAAAPGGLAVAAANVQFDTDTLELKAKTEETIPFTNDDSVEHNISIYEDESAAKELFKGTIIPGGQETTYQVPPLAKGNYYFQCDVHPAMNGTVTVQ